MRAHVGEQGGNKALLVFGCDRRPLPRYALGDLAGEALRVHDEVAKLLFGSPRMLDLLLELMLQPGKRAIPVSFCQTQDPAQILLSVAENRVKRTYGLFEYVDSPLEDIQHTFFYSSLHPQVEDLDYFVLTDAVYASDPLLDSHRIPWQVVVDQKVAELEVPALATSLGGDQYLRTRFVTESFDGPILFHRCLLTVEHVDTPPARSNQLGEVPLERARCGAGNDLQLLQPEQDRHDLGH